MAEKKSHDPGTFCWYELATSDPASATRFYQALFGWQASEVAAGEGAPYTLLRLRGLDVGGLYALGAEQTRMGIPPHWLPYVAVASADATARRAVELGATTLLEPFDVQDFGRMAAFQDDQGGAFAVWQAKAHIGAGLVDEPGSFCWTELMTHDTARARSFYSALFGWTTVDMPMGPMTYTIFKMGTTSIAGCMAISPEMGPVPPHWMPYVAVSDADGLAKRLVELGGRLLHGPADVPGVGRFAVFQDAEGAALSLIRLAQGS